MEKQSGSMKLMQKHVVISKDDSVSIGALPRRKKRNRDCIYPDGKKRRRGEMVLTYFAMEGFLGWKGRISIYYSGALTRKVNWEFLGSFLKVGG